MFVLLMLARMLSICIHGDYDCESCACMCASECARCAYECDACDYACDYDKYSAYESDYATLVTMCATTMTVTMVTMVMMVMMVMIIMVTLVMIDRCSDSTTRRSLRADRDESTWRRKAPVNVNARKANKQICII